MLASSPMDRLAIIDFAIAQAAWLILACKLHRAARIDFIERKCAREVNYRRSGNMPFPQPTWIREPVNLTCENWSRLSLAGIIKVLRSIFAICAACANSQQVYGEINSRNLRKRHPFLHLPTVNQFPQLVPAEISSPNRNQALLARIDFHLRRAAGIDFRLRKLRELISSEKSFVTCRSARIDFAVPMLGELNAQCTNDQFS